MTKYAVVFALSALIFLLIGCDLSTEVPVVALVYSHYEAVDTPPVSVAFDSMHDSAEKIVANNSNRPQTYHISVDSSDIPIWRLYFLITNGNRARQATPKVSLLNAPAGAIEGNKIDSRSPVGDARYALGAVEHDGLLNALDVPAGEYAPLHLLNVHPDLSALKDADGGSSGCLTRAPNNKVGDKILFNLPHVEDDGRRSLHATARFVRAVGKQRVVFWAPDSVYQACEECSEKGRVPADGRLTDSVLKDFADVFLTSGAGNDIYDWMGDIFGAPWGEHDYCKSNLFISPAHQQQIDILLYNIGNRSGNRVYDGGVLGYYASRNNYSRSAYARSNERILLALHAPWVNVSDRYLANKHRYLRDRQREKEHRTNAIISTLVHEYQHVINFYQRFVLDGADVRTDRDSTWLNEQFSLMAEDLLHHHFSQKTSRAYDYRGVSHLGPGTYGICSGRIPHYLFRHGAGGISRWDGEFWNYGINFSFGAYLLRNYNGAEFIRNAYLTQKKSAAALSHALSQHTAGMDIGEAIRRWGVATLFSDSIDAPSEYKMNNGASGFSAPYNGITYKLGSVNFYNYRSSCQSRYGAFRIFNTTKTAFRLLRGAQDGHSNIIVAALENLDGVAEFKVTLSPGQTLTAVGKRSVTRNNPVFYDE